MTAPDRQLYVDTRLGSYRDYFPSATAEAFSAAAQPARLLDEFVLDLILQWRTTAYIASMPAMLLESLGTFSQAYMASVSPDSSVLAFADVVLAKLSLKLPDLVDDQQLRSRIARELVTITTEIREARTAVSPKVDIEAIWNEYLQLGPFAMSVWSAQRVAFVTFYNAYETFLVRCVRQATATDAMRTTSKAFKPALREEFATDIIDPCWTAPTLNLARLVRHSLSHAGGRQTPDLEKQRHNINLIDDVLQIAPDDNHALLHVLFTAVESLISNAVQLPQFA